MSAASPAINIEDKRRERDVRASLRRLYFRRRLFQSTARGATIAASALIALCMIALLDHRWPLPQAARVVLLSLVLLSAFLLLAHAVWFFLRQRTLAEIAREIERATGSNRNALVTLAESLEGMTATDVRLYMFARLESQARVELEKLDERVVAPREGAVRGVGLLAFMLLLLLALRLAAPLAFAREARRVLWLASNDAISKESISSGPTSGNESGAAISVEELRVRVVPPAYSGLSVEEVSGDAPVRALAGSQIEVILSARGEVEGATLGFNGAINPMRSLGQGSFSGTFVASVSGAFEARVVADERSAPAPVVRAVEIYNDVAPQARITEPASDQLLRSLPNAPVAVRWAASDDLGLASVALKYIKSRGEGDSAKFTSGEVIIGNVERGSLREWQGAASLDLQHLDMQAGDTLVFWIEARDRNPNGNNLGRSASLAIAVAAPELAKLTLSDLMPNEIGRFLLSERQIITHTEKLHGERARLSEAEIKKRANDIAAEQRDFKNSFNDYIKLEGAGEEEEASASGDKAPSVEEQVRAAEDERTQPHMHGIPEPPAGSPSSVKDMTYAIRAMWDAEDALTNANTAEALNYEREALMRLKRAQAAVRYIPPILPQSKPLDLKRRYAGELQEIRTRLEKLARRPEMKESAPVRAALADAYAALGDLQETLGVSVNARPGAIGRARESARQAADRLVAVQSGDHAATIAEAAGQLRVVEVELGRTETGGTSDEFAKRISKPLALLTQAASNLFAIAESRTRAGAGDTNPLLPVDDARAAEYFRRLAGGGK